MPQWSARLQRRMCSVRLYKANGDLAELAFSHAAELIGRTYEGVSNPPAGFRPTRKVREGELPFGPGVLDEVRTPWQQLTPRSRRQVCHGSSLYVYPSVLPTNVRYLTVQCLAAAMRKRNARRPSRVRPGVCRAMLYVHHTCSFAR